jgi:hypothetical protein
LVNIRLHTGNQLPRLPGSALKVPGWVRWVVVGSYPLSSQAPTPVEVELGCDNILEFGGGKPPLILVACSFISIDEYRNFNQLIYLDI